MLRALLIEIRDRPLVYALLLAVVARIVVFCGAVVWPIPNEDLLPVSPLLTPGYLDFQFYWKSLQRYSSTPLNEFFSDFVAFYQRPLESQLGYMIAGPVFPMLVGLFGYSEGSTLPFAIFYLVMSSFTAALWLQWMARFEISSFWLFVFAVTPNPVWFMLIVSPDAMFAFWVCVFFLSYFRERWNNWELLFWSGSVVLALMTRPNGYSLLLFVLIDMTVSHLFRGRFHILNIVGVSFILVICSLYLFPYFITAMRNSFNVVYYFSIPSLEYLEGLVPQLFDGVDLVLSWTALVGAKLLYFCGLRPSYGDTSIGLVFLRSGAGIVLLPGLIYLAVAMPWRQRMFVAVFCLPIFMGPTQDRYNLPIFPILFLYGVMAYEAFARKLLRSWGWVPAASKETD